MDIKMAAPSTGITATRSQASGEHVAPPQERAKVGLVAMNALGQVVANLNPIRNPTPTNALTPNP